jgi:hypothetical protein
MYHRCEYGHTYITTVFHKFTPFISLREFGFEAQLNSIVLFLRSKCTHWTEIEQRLVAGVKNLSKYSPIKIIWWVGILMWWIGNQFLCSTTERLDATDIWLPLRWGYRFFLDEPHA